MTDHLATVTEYLAAVAAHDSDRLRAVLHPDAEFRNGPNVAAGRNAFVGAFETVYPAVDRNEVRHIFIDGDAACAVYDFVTPTSVGSVLSMELLVLRGRPHRLERAALRPATLARSARRSSGEGCG